MPSQCCPSFAQLSATHVASVHVRPSRPHIAYTATLRGAQERAILVHHTYTLLQVVLILHHSPIPLKVGRHESFKRPWLLLKRIRISPLVGVCFQLFFCLLHAHNGHCSGYWNSMWPKQKHRKRRVVHAGPMPDICGDRHNAAAAIGKIDSHTIITDTSTRS